MTASEVAQRPVAEKAITALADLLRGAPLKRRQDVNLVPGVRLRRVAAGGDRQDAAHPECGRPRNHWVSVWER
jgi:hypothetical protein